MGAGIKGLSLVQLFVDSWAVVQGNQDLCLGISVRLAVLPSCEWSFLQPHLES